MKSRVIIAIVLILASFAVSASSLIYSKVTVDEMCDKIEKLRSVISSSDPEAYDRAEQFCKDWEESEKVFMLFTDHNKLEEVGFMVDILPRMIEDTASSGTKDELLHQCEMIIAMMRHLGKLEIPSLENLL